MFGSIQLYMWQSVMTRSVMEMSMTPWWLW
jgi:hypothetical protein